MYEESVKNLKALGVVRDIFEELQLGGFSGVESGPKVVGSEEDAEDFLIGLP